MPTDLPPEQTPPPWLVSVLRVVVFVATVRDETIAHTLILRYLISDTSEAAALGITRVALFFMHRRWRAGVWLLRLVILLMRVAAWVRPDLNGPFLRRALKPEA
jgi:hypothetical protein